MTEDIPTADRVDIKVIIGDVKNLAHGPLITDIVEIEDRVPNAVLLAHVQKEPCDLDLK